MNTTGRTDPWTAATLGAVMLLLSTGGVIHGTRVAIAQGLYHRAKYVMKTCDPELRLGVLNRAYRVYPHNYWACLVAVEQAYRLAEGAGDGAPDYFQTADMWCRRGLAQNSYKRRLRWFMSRLLRRESPQAAAEYWQAYTDWQFWEPANHAILARLYAATGDLEKAEQSLAWARGAASYASAAAAVDREKAKRNPPGL
jgi:hypothetical protein